MVSDGGHSREQQASTYRNPGEGQFGLKGQLALHIAVWLRMGLELGFEHFNLFLRQSRSSKNLGAGFKLLAVGGD